MIHSLKLSPFTRRRLTNIVRLQMDLLYFAASTDKYTEIACKRYFDDGEGLHQAFKGRGNAIAGWLREHPAIARDIEWFSRACSHIDDQGTEEEQREKASAWCFRLSVEAEALLYPRCKDIFIGDYFSGKPTLSEKDKRKKKEQGMVLDYREHAQDFLLAFYEKHLGKSGNPGSRPEFPAALFTPKGAGAYGRREFLDEFIKHNPSLEICPCCDENRLYIKNKATMRTEIDHFLPKAKYPHLACHPYNLVPVCHHCNASTKGESDPMEGRKSLSRNLFPYGKTKLSQHGRITLEKPTNTTASTDADAADHIQQLTLVPHRISSSKMAEEKEEEKARRLELEEEVDEAINLLKALYGIPERWHNMQKTYTQATDQQRQDTEAQTMQAMLMSETLVRRICQFLGHSERFLGIQERIESQNTSLRGSNVSQVIYNDLKHLLYYLDHDDQGKEPFVFAMTWILAAKIKEEVQPATIGGKSPLVDEIVSWFLQNATTLKQRDDHVEGLLKRLEE